MQGILVKCILTIELETKDSVSGFTAAENITDVSIGAKLNINALAFVPSQCFAPEIATQGSFSVITN